ncbi:MAG TPA: prepilin-type N-terminal cleavage/methylation domain-containing protein [Steroidobacteraceae bacterium]
MNARGFTLVELVIAIAIASIVMVFSILFMRAPIDAYEAHSRRTDLVNNAASAWPRMEADLRNALPNSVRARRNGNVVVLEMLPVLGVARYKTSPSTVPITTAGVYAGVTPAFLSVNTLNGNAYALAGSMAAATNFTNPAGAVTGEQQIGVNPAPAFTSDSPRRNLYFVARPVTWLCDEGLGTLQRYSGYNIAALQTARDTAGELTGAGAAVEPVARGLTSCVFDVTPPGSTTQSQTAAVHLTATRNGDSVTLLHSVRSEYVP